MHIESDAVPLAARMSEGEIRVNVRKAKDAGVGGVFFIPSRYSVEEMHLDERFLGACRAEGMPIVLVERNLRGYSRELTHDLVAVDDVDGAARLTRHLLNLGRRRASRNCRRVPD
ncbi:hypothetical protein [Gemmata palustris]|uniref:hypothetical protein n=1 Tax=Gemmata palustris TaxID=2822762 RepID=UPI001FE60983|nr:hypothetical protein [Gemmata palustris]